MAILSEAKQQETTNRRCGSGSALSLSTSDRAVHGQPDRSTEEGWFSRLGTGARLLYEELAGRRQTTPHA
jgi:hypothetical protein